MDGYGFGVSNTLQKFLYHKKQIPGEFGCKEMPGELWEMKQEEAVVKGKWISLPIVDALHGRAWELMQSE